MAINFDISSHGSVCLVRPQTPESIEILNSFIDECVMEHTMFGNAIAVEPRYLSDFLDGLAEFINTIDVDLIKS